MYSYTISSLPQYPVSFNQLCFGTKFFPAKVLILPLLAPLLSAVHLTVCSIAQTVLANGGLQFSVLLPIDVTFEAIRQQFNR